MNNDARRILQSHEWKKFWCSLSMVCDVWDIEMQSHKLNMTTLHSSYTLHEITCYDICFFV